MNTSHSTPVRPTARVFAEHKRDDMQRFAEYDMRQPEKKDEDDKEETLFNGLLGILDLEPGDPIVNPPVGLTFKSCSTFVEDANKASHHIKELMSECPSSHLLPG